MKVSGIAAVVVAALVFAQWLNYKTPGIPRLPDGRPNLSAPAPRAGGHPDLSGIWQLKPGPCAPKMRSSFALGIIAAAASSAISARASLAVCPISPGRRAGEQEQG
jgi:hypothetical protein